MNKQRKKEWLFVLLLFILAAAIRAWPEIKAGTWPIGYDTFNTYAPDIIKFDGNFLRWFWGSNLLYFLLWPFYKLFSIDPYLMVKIAGPVIYGLLSISLYLFCRKFLRWSGLLSFLVGLLFIVQLPALRISWDLFRNMLGLIFLLPSLYLLENNHRLRNSILLMVLSILIVLSNQLVAGLWFIILFVWFFKQIYKKEYRHFWGIFIVVIPSIVIFFLSLKAPTINSFREHVIYKGETDIILGYFEAYRNNYSYIELVKTIFGYFWLCFQFVLPLALYGWWLLRKNLILTTFTIWLLIGTFSSLLFGGYGIFFWSRWLIMLVIPFSIYAVWALSDIYRRLAALRFFQKPWTSKFLKVVSIIIFTAYLGFFAWQNYPFVVIPSQDAKPPFKNDKYNSFIPPSMINNSVGFEVIKDVAAGIDYLNKTPESSMILADNRFRGMVLTNLDFSQRYIYTYPWSTEIDQKLVDEMRNKNIGPIYTIWTSHESVQGFDRVFQSGQISIYRDKKSYATYQAKNK